MEKLNLKLIFQKMSSTTFNFLRLFLLCYKTYLCWESCFGIIDSSIDYRHRENLSLWLLRADNDFMAHNQSNQSINFKKGFKGVHQKWDWSSKELFKYTCILLLVCGKVNVEILRDPVSDLHLTFCPIKIWGEYLKAAKSVLMATGSSFILRAIIFSKLLKT